MHTAVSIQGPRHTYLPFHLGFHDKMDFEARFPPVMPAVPRPAMVPFDASPTLLGVA